MDLGTWVGSVLWMGADTGVCPYDAGVSFDFNKIRPLTETRVSPEMERKGIKLIFELSIFNFQFNG